MIPVKKYHFYQLLLGNDITPAQLADIQYSLTHVSIFINSADLAKLPHSCKATLIRCDKSWISVHTSRP